MGDLVSTLQDDPMLERLHIISTDDQSCCGKYLGKEDKNQEPTVHPTTGKYEERHGKTPGLFSFFLWELDRFLKRCTKHVTQYIQN